MASDMDVEFLQRVDQNASDRDDCRSEPAREMPTSPLVFIAMEFDMGGIIRLPRTRG